MSPHRALAYTWAAKLLTAGIVLLLFAITLLLVQVRSLQASIEEGRAERNAQVCALLEVESRVDRGKFVQLCSR